MAGKSKIYFDIILSDTQYTPNNFLNRFKDNFDPVKPPNVGQNFEFATILATFVHKFNGQ